VLNELHDPVHICLQQPIKILYMTANQLRGHDPQREQRHTEMLIRYVIGYFRVWLQFLHLSPVVIGILKVVQQQQTSSGVAMHRML